jgi:hypothetical protein
VGLTDQRYDDGTENYISREAAHQRVNPQGRVAN